MLSLSRRSLLVALLFAANFAADVALAKDGDSGSGSGNSGSGSNNSGSGSGDDGDDRDDGDDDDGGDPSSGGRDDDHERATEAVRRGKAVPLKKLREHLAQNFPGKILDVSLRRRSGDYYYNVRILAKGNRLKMLSLNALTLKLREN
jgi:hypothetical protein